MTKIVNISKKNENNALLFGTKIKNGKENTNVKDFFVITLRLTTKNEVANRILMSRLSCKVKSFLSFHFTKMVIILINISHHPVELIKFI